MTDNIEQRRWRPRFISSTYRPEAKVGRFLSVLIFYGVAFGLYRGIQDNYLAEIVHIAPFERGVVEFFRELPGLFLIFILALMYRFSDSRVFKTGIALTAGGLAGLLLTSSAEFFLTKVFVVLFMIIYSMGEHIMMPVRSTIAMDLAKKEKSGSSLGITASIGQFGNIAGFLLVSAIFFAAGKLGFGRADIAGYRIVFGVSTALMIATMMIAAALKETTLKAPRQRFYFAKKFRKFYILEIFYGYIRSLCADYLLQSRPVDYGNSLRCLRCIHNDFKPFNRQAYRQTWIQNNYGNGHSYFDCCLSAVRFCAQIIFA